jgi:NAD(P)-dependent dehydrogenase (short-subunit alcohol dehydrogenase family)
MMSEPRSVVVIGGTSGIGLEIVRHFVADGASVVLSSRDEGRAKEVAASVGGAARGVGFDLAEPASIAGALDDVERCDALVLAAIERDANSVASYDVARALRLITLKLVGYTEVVHALLPKMPEDSSIVIFGGRAKDRPYPGSTTVSTVNGGVTGLVNSLAVEIAPRRVNGVHPGIVGDSPEWSAKPAEVLDGHRARTPTGRLATMAQIVDAVGFLVRNGGVNAVNLYVDGGWLVT